MTPHVTAAAVDVTPWSGRPAATRAARPTHGASIQPRRNLVPAMAADDRNPVRATYCRARPLRHILTHRARSLLRGDAPRSQENESGGPSE